MGKLKALAAILQKHQSICVAFSGGVDSSFLLWVAASIGMQKVIAATASGSMVPLREMNTAMQFAEALHIPHYIFAANEYAIPGFVQNAPDRCYFCKQSIMTQMKDFALAQGILTVVDGSNTDDLQDHRPGALALSELGILSPLVEADFSKADVRRYSKRLGMSGYDRASAACLASRIPYYTAITQDALSRIEHAENILSDLGFIAFRVRHYDDLAKIEIASTQMEKLFSMREKVVSQLKKVGYRYISLDLEPFQSGNMNKVLIKKQSPAPGHHKGCVDNE